MQPCPVCGGMTIDAAGRCTQCGTFRGQPTMGVPTQPQPTQPVPPYPYAGQPSGPPYAGQPSGPPYAGQPSGPPYAGQPSGPPYPGQPSGPPFGGPPSGPPYTTPISGAPVTVPVPYPGYQAPPAQRRSAFVPLIAVASAVVVLVAAIIVVLVVKGHKSGGTGGNPVAGGSSASSTPTTLVDPCVIGTWKVTSDQMDVDFGGGYGKVSVTNQKPYTIKLRADGTGVEDMGEATIFQGEVNDVIYTVGFSGTATYSYRTADGQLTFSGAVATGHWVLLVNDKTVSSGESVASSDPVKYTCSGDTMTEQRSDDSIQMSRTSHDA